MKFKYYHIDNRKWKLEKVSANFYQLTLFENEKYAGAWCFDSRAGAMAEILSYAEIDEDDYEAD